MCKNASLNLGPLAICKLAGHQWLIQAASIVSITTLVENKVHLFIDRMENIYPGVNPWHFIFQTDLLGNGHYVRKKSDGS